jgi:hypothetical protein
LPDPDIEVDPEIITPDDPRWPDDEQTEPDDTIPTPSPDTTDGENEETDPTPEPSQEPSPQPDGYRSRAQEPELEQPADEDPVVTPDKDSTDDSPISDEELKKLNKLINVNDAKLMSAVSSFLTELDPEQVKSRISKRS